METTPLKAIKQYCYECSGESKAEVKRCSSETCPLKPFRFGKNPFNKREMTEEQKQVLRDRITEVRNSKKG